MASKASIGVKPAETLQVCISDHRNCMIAHHRIGLTRREWPDRQEASLSGKGEHGLYHRAHALRCDDRIERMSSPICVPERKRGIVLKARAPVNGTICSAVLSIDITIEGWREHRMIERGIVGAEHFGPGTGNAHLAQLFFPCLACGAPYSVKIPVPGSPRRDSSTHRQRSPQRYQPSRAERYRLWTERKGTPSHLFPWLP